MSNAAPPKPVHERTRFEIAPPRRGAIAVVVPDEYKDLYATTTKRPVIKVPAPVLLQTAAPVERLSKKTGFLIDELMRVMKLANGVGLAAPQLGVLQRIIVVHPPDEKPHVLINPRITSADGSQTGTEGCLSIPGLYGDVERFDTIEVEALDRKGREFVFELEGLPARIVQHEIDHLDGILFTDRVDPATLHWKDPDGDDEAE